jgi:hypothetical protein
MQVRFSHYSVSLELGSLVLFYDGPTRTLCNVSLCQGYSDPIRPVTSQKEEARESYSLALFQRDEVQPMERDQKSHITPFSSLCLT